MRLKRSGNLQALGCKYALVLFNDLKSKVNIRNPHHIEKRSQFPLRYIQFCPQKTQSGSLNNDR